MEYIIQGKKLIWDFDKNVSDARKWKDDRYLLFCYIRRLRFYHEGSR